MNLEWNHLFLAGFMIKCCLIVFRFSVFISFSFQSDLSLGDRTALVKSASDIDANLLAVLPKGEPPLQSLWVTLTNQLTYCCLALFIELIFFLFLFSVFIQKFQNWRNILRAPSQATWKWTGNVPAHRIWSFSYTCQYSTAIRFVLQ